MDRQSKRQLKDLAKHQSYEQMKLRKQAGKMRRALRKGKGETREQRVTEDNWEELLDEHGHAHKRASLEQIADELRHQQPELETVALDDADAGIVISVASGRCRVFHQGDEVDCVVPPEIAVQQKSALAVGDRVIIERGENNRLIGVLPRHSVLARPDPLHQHRQRLIAANIDVVVHVVSVKAPPLRPRLIDRYLIAIQRGGAQPVICVNKI
ncbi:MAG TPA: GTPase RsgA, partial [Thermoanaerobaculia bacterium]|nr:GTPase RsgA [Thermoanaerobaculia bacterium]